MGEAKKRRAAIDRGEADPGPSAPTPGERGARVSFWTKMQEIAAVLDGDAQRLLLLVLSTAGSDFLRSKNDADRELLFASILGWANEHDEGRNRLRLARNAIRETIEGWNEGAMAFGRFF